MNQTTIARASTHPADLEALRLQLEEDGKFYCDIRNRNSKEAHDRLLHRLQTNDCREIITVIADGDYLADAFDRAGGIGHVDILDAFLDQGMNVDIKDKDGYTALIYACCYQHEECTRFLLDRNASVDAQNNSGYTALMQASRRDFTNIVQMLLEKNANADLQNENGMTALMYASMNGSKEVTQLLLSHGADIELKNKYGKTALDLAEDEEIKEMIRNHVTANYVLK